MEKELEVGKESVRDIISSPSSAKNNLRSLYGIPTDTKLVYAESGGITNLPMFPDDTTLIVPIFPWSELDLEKMLGPVDNLRLLIDTGRVFPIIQHPAFYKNTPHLEFLFERNTPSYFIRGLFAYAAMLGKEPNVVFTERGIPVLVDINELMSHCESRHSSWLEQSKVTEGCWEYRYRNQSIHDEALKAKLHDSLCYRYASVAVCLGRHNTDEIINTFSVKQSSDILLHLHIMFDHVMCHGVGSDFVVRPDTSDGIDFQTSKTTGVTKPHEISFSEEFHVALPKKEDGYVKGLLREEHFMRELDFSLISLESLPEYQDKISRQFSDFRKKIAKIEKSQSLVDRTVQIVLYVTSGLAALGGAATGNIPASASSVAGFIAGAKVPWLADQVAEALKGIHRNKLASYVINTSTNR
ncbi:MAG: hypothetical protein AB2692_18780 [Candidatus Thiodiazotropha sp.]